MKYKIILGLNLVTVLGLISCSQGNSSSSSNGVTYVQVERLARPAVNEGLVLTNASLNAFNSIGPELDLDASIPAVATVQGEATTVLGVVYNLGTVAAGNPSGFPNTPPVADVVGQFLPDVMRISVDDAHYGGLHLLVANTDRTSNSNQNMVGYTSCVSLTAGAPLLCGGRKIRDDVIDITLTYLALGATQAAPAAAGVVPSYAVSDAINYNTQHTTPLLATFPFLASPL